jgi:predicted HNH restriction endonuclease
VIILAKQLTERQKEYRKYLKSEQWKQKREEVLERHGHKCVFCDSSNKLQVHHMNYDNVGNEGVLDLFVVCSGCHTRMHMGRAKIWVFNQEEYNAFQLIKHIICDDRTWYATFHY